MAKGNDAQSELAANKMLEKLDEEHDPMTWKGMIKAFNVMWVEKSEQHKEAKLKFYLDIKLEWRMLVVGGLKYDQVTDFTVNTYAPLVKRMAEKGEFTKFGESINYFFDRVIEGEGFEKHLVNEKIWNRGNYIFNCHFFKGAPIGHGK